MTRGLKLLAAALSVLLLCCPSPQSACQPRSATVPRTATSTASQNDAQLRGLLEQFVRPPRDYSPVPIWWWSGERLDLPRLEWQLDRMRDGHVYNAVILNLAPTGPLYGARADNPPFFSQRWWTILRAVVERARARGMRLWLYDQLGFSTARIQDRLMDREPAWRAPDLRVLERDVAGPAEVRMTAPGRAVAACALALDEGGKPSGILADITASLREGYLTKAMPPGRWRVMLFYEAPGGFDYMNVTAAGKLLNYVHGEYERKLGPHLGRTIAGTFQDELPPMNRWTRGFVEEFRRRKGYDVRQWLPMLWYDLGPRTRKVRCDVASVQTELLEKAFFRPLWAWHQRHGMLCSYDQMTRDADPVEANRQYVDYMRVMRWFQAPGNDQTGLSRPHSSLAHLYGRPRVWLEGFYNSGWGQTLEELSQRIHEFYAQGSNLYNPHAWYCSTLGGWWEWAPPCTSFRQPYWRHYPPFADYVARLSWLLSRGRHVTDIAVLYPTSTIHAGGTYYGTYDERAYRARDTYRAVCARLEALGVDYDVLDEASLMRGRVVGGMLQIADERYRCIVLPSVTTLPRRGIEQLEHLARTGGVVAAIGDLPDGSSDSGGGDLAVRHAMERLFGSGAGAGASASSARPSASDGQAAVRVRRGTLYAATDTDALVEAVLQRCPKHAGGVERYIHRRVAGTDLYWVLGAGSGRTRVVLRGAGRPHLLMPWSGRIVSVAGVPSGSGRISVQVDFSESRSLFVLLDASGRRVPVAGPNPGTPKSAIWPAIPGANPASKPATSVPTSLVLPEQWACELVPTLDNRWGDFALPPSQGPLRAECRQFFYREETPGENGLEAGWHTPGHQDDAWRTVTATYGTYWWITRPDVGDRNLKLPGPDDGDWRPDRTVWQPAIFSLKYGIEKNPLYAEWLGPKGRVPDEYLDFGTAPAGTVRFAVTFLHVEAPCDVRIRCGPGDARVAVNGAWLPAQEPVIAHLLAGYNALSVQFRHPSNRPFRTYVHVGPAEGGGDSPKWIWASRQTDVSDCYFRKTFTLESVPQVALLSITADNGYEVFVNGVRVGRDVGASTEIWANAERYPVARLLRRGRNVIAVHGMNLGGPAGLIAVLWFQVRRGGQVTWRSMETDQTWRVAPGMGGVAASWAAPAFDDGAWTPATVVGRYPCEPWGVVQRLLRNEPAILPDSAWLNGEVLPWQPGLIMDPRPGLAKPVGWYRFRTPPGATALNLAVVGKCRVFVEGRECGVSSNGEVEVPLDLQGPSLTVAVRIEQAAGCYEGAAFKAPVRFTVEGGTIRTGEWALQGLPQYSGGVRYSQTVEVPAALATAPVVLDLGRVRGTAEVAVNGRSAGVRIWKPYRFDVSGLLRAGENRVEITVFNTLGPFFGAGYPTPYVYPRQEVSGMFGPVRLVSGDSVPPDSPDISGLVNIALADQGATVRASSEHPSGLYPAASIIAGHSSGELWARGGGWNDATEGQFPDWLEIELPRPASVRAIRILTLEPAVRYGIRDFDILAMQASGWVRLAEVRDNEDGVVSIGVPPTVTQRIRVIVHGSNDDLYSRILAVQVYAPATGADGAAR